MFSTGLFVFTFSVFFLYSQCEIEFTFNAQQEKEKTRMLKERQTFNAPLLFRQEHPLSEEHHPLEPHRRLHPEERHLVYRPDDHEPGGA